MATVFFVNFLNIVTLGTGDEGNPGPAESRALRFLAAEVPRWSPENRCYSCHHNGDAARALFQADRFFGSVPPDALADSIAWLSRPEDWDHNGGRGAPADKRLARVQFAAALAGAVASGKIEDRSILLRVAARLAMDQAEDGSWSIEGDEAGLIGSPATYGGPLATVAVRDVLRLADRDRFRETILRAERWLLGRPIHNLLDASAALMALDGASLSLDEAEAVRRRALALIRDGESDSGGWGPYATSPPEPFDTAVVLLALSRMPGDGSVETMIRRGRSWLIEAQRPDGSWAETTRPSGGESYAQRLSTAGWALRALLATRTAASGP